MWHSGIARKATTLVSGKDKITCKTFRGSSMVNLYQRMGFTKVAYEDYFVTLEKRINPASKPPAPGP